MISASDRLKGIELIEEANHAGARREKACKELGISFRTYQRWTRKGCIETDRRSNTNKRSEPANKLTPEERENILEICARIEYRSLPPSQIVPDLADKNIYISLGSQLLPDIERSQTIISQRKSPGTDPR